jgi:uncharacterized protein YktA (UPF0223 family)
VILREVYDASLGITLLTFTNCFSFVCLVEAADGNVYCGISDSMITNGKVFNSSTWICCLTNKFEIYSNASIRKQNDHINSNPSSLLSLGFLLNVGGCGFYFSGKGMSINLDELGTGLISPSFTRRRIVVGVLMYEISPSPSPSRPCLIAGLAESPISNAVSASISCSNLCTVDSTLQQLLSASITSLNQVIYLDAEISKLFKHLLQQTALVYEELVFMMQFLCKQEMFKAIITFKNQMKNAVSNFEKRKPDPIAYFNAEGMRIAI